MRNICFIGAFDKLDLLLYIAKIINALGKKVIIIDATELQKAKYIVPTIYPTKSYITRFGDIDIAIGFESYEDVEKYIGLTEEQKMKYDFAIVNIDRGDIFKNFNNVDTVKNYFVTSFEAYSIKRGLEAIKQIDKPIPVTKIIFSNSMNETDDYYLEYLALGYKVMWDENKIIFPYDTQDIEAMIENQKVSKIRTKGLSLAYKEDLEYIITDIVPGVNINNLRKVMKNIEKEG